MLEVDERVAGPQLMAQLVAGDQLAGALEQRFQQRQGLFREGLPTAVVREFARAQVQFEDVEADDAGGRRRRLAMAARS